MAFKSENFLKLSNFIGISSLDIGARGGPNEDLASIAKAVDMYCFEPDMEEYNKLLDLPKGIWKSLTFIPSAVAANEETFSLNLYRQRGCSSMFKADVKTAELFSRGDYYIFDSNVSVSGKSLDQLILEYDIKYPSFLKIDIQGMEIECFKGAVDALSNSLVGIRSEISFFPLYEGNPLFSDVNSELSKYGFVPMRFLELHEWRRTTKVKWPKKSKGIIPYSRGQMIHGDVLYLLHPECLSDNTESEIKRLIRLALVSICYGHIDHAYAIFNRQNVTNYVKENLDFDPIIALKKLSRKKCLRLITL